jgi:hypothetical protein
MVFGMVLSGVATTPTVFKVPAVAGGFADALAKAAATAGDVELRLATGLHQVLSPLVITSAHAHADKALAVTPDDPAAAAPTISGGVAVTGPWTQDATNTKLWSAALPADINLTVGQTMQAWRGADRLTLARSSDLVYKLATAGQRHSQLHCLMHPPPTHPPTCGGVL